MTNIESARTIANAASLLNIENDARTLTTAREAHSLNIEQAEQGRRLHLRGVITYFDPDYGTGDAAIFVQDTTGSVFIRASSASVPALAAGVVIEVWGISAPGGFGPIVVNPAFRIVGRAPLPRKALHVSLATLKTGVADAQWVEVEGSVHRVTESARSVTLLLEMRDGPVNVTMPGHPVESYSKLVDAQVRILANAAPTTDSAGRMIGVHLLAPNLSALRVITPAAGDPFAIPSIPIDRLLRWGHLATTAHRVHLRGYVTLQWLGSLLCIQDGTRSICAQTSQANSVAVGSLVDVAGFLKTDNNAPIITDAIFKTSEKRTLIAPQPTTAEAILRGGYDSKLIQMDGQLIGREENSSEITLLLSSGNTLFPATLPNTLAGTVLSSRKLGSKIRIVGICSVQIDAQRHAQEGTAPIESFRVLLRSPSDVILLKPPSWWTPLHAILLLVLAFLSTLVILAWAAALRNQVERQTSLLRESERRFRHMALHDSLTGLATRLLLQDRLEIAFESAKRRRSGLATLMVDLDKFKEINDTHGHPAGDQVLRVTANRLLLAVRKADTVARLGGDEFVILLQDLTELTEAERVASLVVESLSLPIAVNGHEVCVSASVGVCAISADEVDAVDLLKNADLALYQAKVGGRNQFQSYKPDFSAKATAC